jgi:hypothetical protein
MKHPTESQLNEYLDGELETGSRRSIETHLAGCAACRQALDELRRLSAGLALLPEEPLQADLAARVLERLPRRRSGLAWKLALAVQAGFALGAFLLAAGNLLPRLEIPPLQDLLPLALPVLELPEITLPALAIPGLALQPSSLQLAFLAASTLLLWGVGNAILLRKGNTVHNGS